MSTEAKSYRINDACTALKVCLATIYNMIHRGEIKAARIRKQYRIPASEIVRVLTPLPASDQKC